MDGNTATVGAIPTQEVVARRVVSTATDISNAPSAMVVSWVDIFRRGVRAGGLDWHPPHLSGSPEEIVLEWRKANRGLTVFIRGFRAEVLKIAGPSLANDIQEVQLVTDDDSAALWKWLLNG